MAVSLARLGWADETSLGYVQELTQGAWPDEDAAIGLLCIRDPRAVAAANAILADRNHSLRNVMAKAAGKFGDKSHCAGLVEALLTWSPETRASAWQSLAQLGWTPSTNRDRAIAAVYAGDAEKAAAEGPDAVEALVAALWFIGADSVVDPVSIAAARLLSKFPTPETELALLRFALYDPLPDKQKLEPAMESLLEIGRDTSVRHLLDCWNKHKQSSRSSERLGYVARRVLNRNACSMSTEVLQRVVACPGLERDKYSEWPDNADEEFLDGISFPSQPAKEELARRSSQPRRE
jgi:hypothetical protein